MKIEGDRTHSAAGLSATDTAAAKSRAPASGSRTTPEDRLELSPGADLLVAARRAADQAPAIRQARVEEARRAIENNTPVDAEQIADRIIDELLES